MSRTTLTVWKFSTPTAADEAFADHEPSELIFTHLGAEQETALREVLSAE